MQSKLHKKYMVEEVTIRVGVSGPGLQSTAQYSIHIDDKEYFRGDASQSTTVINDIVSNLEYGEHVLRIHYHDVNPNGSTFNVEVVGIQGVLLSGWGRWFLSDVKFDSSHLIDGELTDTMSMCVNLGNPGEYRIKFSIPAYKWFLATIPGDFGNDRYDTSGLLTKSS